jgi:PIN domain nuclease of toxin-antitoxin system
MEAIQNPKNTIFFSQISLFEIAIKQNIGKLPLFKSDTDEIYHQAIKDDFTFLSVQNKHILSYQKTPLLSEHRDPFDRLLIATAHTENAIVLTADKNFKLYPNFIEVLW